MGGFQSAACVTRRGVRRNERSAAERVDGGAGRALSRDRSPTSPPTPGKTRARGTRLDDPLGAAAAHRPDAASSLSSAVATSYGAVRTALAAQAGNSAAQAASSASLSAVNPLPANATLVASLANLKALGLDPVDPKTSDGAIGLSSAYAFNYTQSGAAGTLDAIGALTHELTEVMGRVGSVGAYYGPGVYTTLDLFRYTNTNLANVAKGTPSRALATSGANTAYFSIDGGKTDLGNYDASNGSQGDYSDLNASMRGDPFGGSYMGVAEQLTGGDVVQMAAIGWNLSSKGVALAQVAAAYASV